MTPETQKLWIENHWYGRGTLVTAIGIAVLFGASLVWEEWFEAHPWGMLALDAAVCPGIPIAIAFIVWYKKKQVS